MGLASLGLVGAAFLGLRALEPEATRASAAGPTISMVVHPYKPPTPIACDGSATIPARLQADVFVTTPVPAALPVVSFTFGTHDYASKGGTLVDHVIWVDFTRNISVPAGTSKIKPAEDQYFNVPAELPAGHYFFTATIFGGSSTTCSFFYPG